MYQNSRLRTTNQKPKTLASPKGLFVAALLVVLILVAVGSFFLLRHKDAPTKQDAGKPATQTNSFNKKQYSLTDPTSQWVVVNKIRPLNPKTYEPAGMRTPDITTSSGQQLNDAAATALESMAKAAADQGVNLKLVSAYRSYSTQVATYDSEVRGYGQAQADRESARPGYSEHQTGWAADLGAASGKCQIQACFADAPEGKWLAANAYKYGFIIRYPKNKEHVTGYLYEPWHVRFVGQELASEMHNQKVETLEEFFGLPAAPSY